MKCIVSFVWSVIQRNLLYWYRQQLHARAKQITPSVPGIEFKWSFCVLLLSWQAKRFLIETSPNALGQVSVVPYLLRDVGRALLCPCCLVLSISTSARGFWCRAQRDWISFWLVSFLSLTGKLQLCKHATVQTCNRMFQVRKVNIVSCKFPRRDEGACLGNLVDP